MKTQLNNANIMMYKNSAKRTDYFAAFDSFIKTLINSKSFLRLSTQGFVFGSCLDWSNPTCYHCKAWFSSPQEVDSLRYNVIKGLAKEFPKSRGFKIEAGVLTNDKKHRFSQDYFRVEVTNKKDKQFSKSVKISIVHSTYDEFIIGVTLYDEDYKRHTF